MACSPFFAALGMIAEHGAPSSGTRRGVLSPRQPEMAAASARVTGRSEREEGRPVIRRAYSLMCKIAGVRRSQ
jgi:hypothetical protein